MNRRNLFKLAGAAMAAMPWIQKGAVAHSGNSAEQNYGDNGALNVGALHVNEFVADSVWINPGTAWSIGAALTLGEFVTPEVSEYEALWCKNAVGPFRLGDCLQIRHVDFATTPLAVTSAWFEITGVLLDGGHDPHGFHAWIVRHIGGGAPGIVIKDSNTLINIGPLASQASLLQIGVMDAN